MSSETEESSRYVYVSDKPEEQAELKEGVSLFETYYNLEPKRGTIHVRRIDEKHLEMSAPYFSLDGLLIKDGAPPEAKVLTADFRGNKRTLKLKLDEWKFDIRF